jgi:hypothetical protein
MNNLANTYRSLGRHDASLAMLEHLLEFRKQNLAEDDPDLGEVSAATHASSACSIVALWY